MKFPTKRTKWIYTGKPPGKGLEHTVTSVDAKANDITTWSQFDPAGAADAGYAWRGNAADFAKNFTPAKPAKA